MDNEQRKKDIRKRLGPLKSRKFFRRISPRRKEVESPRDSPTATDRNRARRQLLFVPFICLLFGGALVVSGLGRIKTKLQSRSWPESTAVVIHSAVTTDTQSMRSNESRRSITTTYYLPHIKYRYEVNGKSYHGDNLDYGWGGIASPEQAAKVLKDYPEGVTVPVFVNPDNPSEAVLELPLAWGDFTFVPIASMVFLGGLIFFVVYLKTPKEDA